MRTTGCNSTPDAAVIIRPTLPITTKLTVCLCMSAAAMKLLEHCSSTLQDCNEALFEVLFTLAQDDWPQVSSVCQSWLQNWLPSNSDHVPLPQVRCPPRPRPSFLPPPPPPSPPPGEVFPSPSPLPLKHLPKNVPRLVHDVSALLRCRSVFLGRTTANVWERQYSYQQ